jgi:ribosomal protein S18 acetylase RimI-like enzyme
MLGLFYTPEALATQMAEGHQFILCYDGSSPVGFASYSLLQPGVYKLNKLYVLPGLQGKGIGKAMVAHITEAIKALDATHLRLNVNIHNTSAIAFYEKAGFYKFKEEDIDIGGGYFMNDFVLELAV